MTGFQTSHGGFKIPSIGLGSAFGSTLDGREDIFEEALNTALEVGYRHIDGAFVYRTEAIIGRVLKKWLSSGKLRREDIFITSKFMPRDGEVRDVEATLKKTLADLQIEYVDLYLVHRALQDDDENIKLWKQMEKQVDAGRAKHIGISNFKLEQIDHLLKNSTIKPVNLQIQLHVYAQRKELVDYCKKNGMTVTAYSPIGAPGRTHEEPLNIIDDETIKKIGAKYNKTAAQVALRFLIQKNIVPVPQSTNAERLKQNFTVFDFTLANEDMKTLEALDKNLMLRFGPPPKKN